MGFSNIFRLVLFIDKIFKFVDEIYIFRISLKKIFINIML